MLIPKEVYDRQERVYQQGAGAKSKLDRAKYNYNAARSQVNYQIAKLNLAKRDLRKTMLTSPYDGHIAWRSVDPHEEIDGDLTALRYQDWKLIFMEQCAEATFQAWREPFVPVRIPLLENLRRDPYERALVTSNTYDDWFLDRAYMLVPAQAYVGQFLKTFKEYPPRQKAASFSLDQVMEKLSTSGGSK